MEVTHYNSPFGTIVIEYSGGRLCSLRFGDPIGAEAQGFIRQWLDDYFAGRRPSHIFPTCFDYATVFQRKVWRIVMDIPYGTTVTYGQLAQLAGCRSAQAIGGALAMNPVWLVVPCHRVVSAKGIGGYAGGIELKKALLRHEGIELY